MKKPALIAFILAVILLLTACGNEQPAAPAEAVPAVQNTQAAPQPETTAQPETAVVPEATAEPEAGKVKIALLISGDLGDMSFWDSANAGMMKFAADHPDVTVDIIEMGSSDTTKYESTLNRIAGEDYGLIIVGTTDMREPLQRVAKKSKFSGRRFIIFDAEIKDNASADYPTVHSIMFNQNEGGYLAGVLAAMMTQNAGAANTAFIGGTKNDIINDFGYGFMQGVRNTNAARGTDIGAYNSYIGDFTNSPKGASLAGSFYDSGVVIQFAAASQAGLGCIDSAKNKRRFIIGVDSDQYAYYEESDPAKAACIVTSVLKRVDLALYNCCELFVEGKLTYGDLEVLGIRDGMVGLVENDNYAACVPEEIREYVKQVSAGIVDGSVTVESGLKRYTPQSKLNDLFDALDPNRK